MSILRRRLYPIYGGATYTDKVLSYGPIAYWPMDEPSGLVAYDLSGNGYNGVYTDATLGQAGIGDGKTCPLFDGVSSYNNIYSTGLRDAFDEAEGSIIAWCTVTNWAGAAWRNVFNLYADANNYVQIAQSSTANRLYYAYGAGGVFESHTENGVTDTGFFQVGVTWSATADQVIYFLRGSPLSTDTVLGTWAGNLASTTTVIGANSTVPFQPWAGKNAHVVLYGRALAPATMADLAMVE